MSRSPTSLPPELARNYPVLIAASARGHEEDVILHSAQGVMQALQEHDLAVGVYSKALDILRATVKK